MSGRGPRSEVGVWRLKSVRSLSEAVWRPKSENCLINIDLNAGLLILKPYIIMYFFSLFGYICMFVFCCVTNKLFWVFEYEVWRMNEVWQWRLKSDVWSMSEVQNPKSENWCLKSTIRSLMYEEWRNLKFDVRSPKTVWSMSKVCEILCEILLMSVQKPKTEVWKFSVCPKSKIRVWNQSLKSVRSLKSVV